MKQNENEQEFLAGANIFTFLAIFLYFFNYEHVQPILYLIYGDWRQYIYLYMINSYILESHDM